MVADNSLGLPVTLGQPDATQVAPGQDASQVAEGRVDFHGASSFSSFTSYFVTRSEVFPTHRIRKAPCLPSPPTPAPHVGSYTALVPSLFKIIFID